jgi:hypothetical protein
MVQRMTAEYPPPQDGHRMDGLSNSAADIAYARSDRTLRGHVLTCLSKWDRCGPRRDGLSRMETGLSPSRVGVARRHSPTRRPYTHSLWAVSNSQMPVAVGKA